MPEPAYEAGKPLLELVDEEALVERRHLRAAGSA